MRIVLVLEHYGNTIDEKGLEIPKPVMCLAGRSGWQ